jgi:hypothetical protein
MDEWVAQRLGAVLDDLAMAAVVVWMISEEDAWDLIENALAERPQPRQLAGDTAPNDHVHSEVSA